MKKAPHTGLMMSVGRANERNYLGDISTVDAYLRNFLYEALERRSSEGDYNDWLEKDLKACDEAAEVFLGLNPNFTTVPKWNRPGGVDEWIKGMVALSETDPKKRLAEFFAYLLADYYALSAYITESTDEDNYKWQLDALIQSYAELLIGVAPATETTEPVAA